MQRFVEGDRVRIDIPDLDDPDHEDYHNRVGEIVDTHKDDAGRTTGDERDSLVYIVGFDDNTVHKFRWRDLRPAPQE